MNGHGYDDAIAELERGAVMTPEATAALEARLVLAFEQHHAALRETPAVPLGPDAVASAPAAHRGRRWLQAAAALLMIAGGFAGWRALQVAPGKAGGREAGAISPAPIVETVAPAHDVASNDGPVRAVQPATHPAHVSAKAGQGPAQVVQPAGFVALPGAEGLPQFESGAIVRVELPLASLPAYGVDISRAGGDRAVEADVLVGQDGQPRAIRLVAAGER